MTGEVRSLFEDSDGTLWAGLSTGSVARITAADSPTPSVELLDSAQGLSAQSGTITIAAAGGRPIFSSGRGLFRFDAEKKRFVPEATFGRRFADGSTRVGSLIEDSRGDLWIASQAVDNTEPWSEPTLGRATRTGEWHPLPVADLARLGEIVGLRVERSEGHEILWVIGVSALLRVELDALQSLPPIGATLMRAVTPLDDRTPLLRSNSAIALPYAKNSLRFRVAAPGLTALSDVKFETEMDGLGQGARHLSAASEREFTNLREGRYRFRARARAGDGEWTIPVEYAFTILPPWWRTPWALTAGVLAAAGCIFGLVRLRTHALRQRTAALETTVTERTAELNSRNQELTRLHRLELDEKTSARLAEEKTRLEMLRYQLNPHFLFNTLNSLYGLVEDHPAASDMVLRLSEFCRLTLSRGADHVQTLGDEFQILGSYLDIEKIRWGESLRVTLDAESAANPVRIPPFLLLPLVENAVKHGGETSRDILQIKVTARVVERGLEIVVANTGRWLPPGTSPARSTHIGLENLRERLRHAYPDAHEFTTGEQEGWVVVRLILQASRP